LIQAIFDIDGYQPVLDQFGGLDEFVDINGAVEFAFIDSG
jgi:hypothetical protein